MEIKKLYSPEPFASNSYLILSEGECAVIDPSCPFCEDDLAGNRLKYVLITHGHFDHFLNLDSWIESTGATVVVSKKDRKLMGDPYGNCYKTFMQADKRYCGAALEVGDGDKLMLGNSQINVGEYPGHTAGSLVYIVENYAFSGDLAFFGGGYGRYDLPSGDMHSLFRSLKRFISLNGALTVFPGHGNSFTIAEYKRNLK